MGSVGGSFRYRIAVGLGIHSVISIGIDIGISSASSPHRVIGSSRMERFVRVSASAGSVYEAEADLEVSSNSSNSSDLEVNSSVEYAQGLDINWAQQPESGHVRRRCVARAHSVCRRATKMLAMTCYWHNKEAAKVAAKLHVTLSERKGT